MLATFADERLPAYPPQHPAIENLWKSLRFRQAEGRRAFEQEEECPLKTKLSKWYKVWGQVTRAFKPGPEYFEWYFHHPHYYYRVDIRFSSVWTIRAPIVFAGEAEDAFSVQQLNAHALRWIRYFPSLRRQYRLDFILSRQKRDA